MATDRSVESAYDPFSIEWALERRLEDELHLLARTAPEAPERRLALHEIARGWICCSVVGGGTRMRWYRLDAFFSIEIDG